jgi:mono/diheme cytochrome c family protein
MGHKLVAGAALAALTLAVAGWWTVEFRAGAEPTGDDAVSVAQGAQLYQAHCAACHGADGAGQANWRVRKPNGKLPAPPLNGDGHTWHHPDAQLQAMVAQGIEALAPAGYESDMAGFGDRLSDAEIRAVLAHVKTWWPEHKRRHQASLGGGD